MQGSEWFNAPGVVYFIQAGNDCEGCKSIKIGVAVKDGLLRRLRSIQSANHTRIRLLREIEFATMREAEAKESELHRRFQKDARSVKPLVGYEWFKASDELHRTIDKEGTLPSDVKHKPKSLDNILKLFT